MPVYHAVIKYFVEHIPCLSDIIWFLEITLHAIIACQGNIVPAGRTARQKNIHPVPAGAPAGLIYATYIALVPAIIYRPSGFHQAGRILFKNLLFAM
jgi:hypothetical protein